MADTIPVAQLRAFVERIERIEADIKDLNGDKSEVYKELRGCGFDVKAVRAVVANRKLDTADREERDAMFELYWSALNGTGTDDATRVHVHGASYSEAKGREYPNDFDLSDNESREMRGFVAGLTDEQKAAALAYDGEDSPVGELTDNQKSEPCLGHATEHSAYVGTAPDENPAQDDVGATASSTNSEHTISPAPERKAAGSAPREMGGEGANTGGEDVDRSASARPSGQVVGAQPAGVDAGIEPGFVERNTSGPDAKRATNPHSPDDLLPVEADSAGEAPSSSQASPATDTDDGFDPSKITFLRKSAADYRPHCQKPEACGASGLRHCYTCQKAIDVAEMAEHARVSV